MSTRVLFVDDEPQVLEGIQRSLRKQVDVHTAGSGAEGLRLLSEAGPFGLVISDMRMPSMNGAQFLAKVREQTPDTVRMILSGQSDLQATIAAVNEGQIYRFLNKPCPPDQLLAAVQDGLNQHRLLTAEKVLLEQTLGGCVSMLIEILGMVCPAASSRASRLRRYTVDLTRALELPERWQWGLAAYVSQIGCMALPGAILSKVEAGQTLTGEEKRLHESHPEVAGKLLASIPRLEEVAEIVPAQFGSLSFAGQPENVRQWDVRTLGRALLRTAVEFDRRTLSGMTREAAVEGVRASKLGIPQTIIDALRCVVPGNLEKVVKQLRLKDLAPGMILDEDLVSPKGIRLVPAGQEVTRSLLVRLGSIAGGVGIAEPFRVMVPT
ncbi:MAG TPA: HD domain-containing phosphohydrolase [Steroidobacteraceae bacterium]|jgi:CheY-like chemotaxis protein|nr:HD domain-containing phosphohydrolase [Steroidobacteraceae bacterium]